MEKSTKVVIAVSLIAVVTGFVVAASNVQAAPGPTGIQWQPIDLKWS